jgi:hypothetical protein
MPSISMGMSACTSACSSTDRSQHYYIRQSFLCDTAVVNERFASVIINKDVDFLTPTRNATFELVDVFAYRSAKSKTLLSLKRSLSTCSTDLRRKKMRTFYKWSAPRHQKLSNPKRVALRLGIIVKSNRIEEQAKPKAQD